MIIAGAWLGMREEYSGNELTCILGVLAGPVVAVQRKAIASPARSGAQEGFQFYLNERGLLNRPARQVQSYAPVQAFLLDIRKD